MWFSSFPNTIYWRQYSFFAEFSLLPCQIFSSVQLLSHVWLFATPWIAAHQASLSITNFLSSLKLMSIESVMPSSHLILCRPLLLLPPIPPSIRVFSNESTLHMRWLKYWSFSLSISPSNEDPGLGSFRMGLLDLLAVLGTHKSLLQHHSSKASILVTHICEGLFMSSWFCSIGLFIYFYASTILFWLLYICPIAWNQEVWCLQLCFPFQNCFGC